MASDRVSGAPAPGAAVDRRYLRVSLGLIAAFMVFEVAAGVVAGSLALLADAAHMLVDAGAIAGSLWAIALTARPASSRFTYGLVRAEILSAAVNGVTLLVTAALVIFEAIVRLLRPSAVEGRTVVVVAVIGAGVNIAATLVLRRADRTSMNIEGAFRHIVTDLYAFVATAAAGAVVWGTGYRRADPIASLVVAAAMVFAAWKLIRASGRVLLEGTPETVDLAEVRRHLEALDEVVSVHELHAWTLGSHRPALSAHVVVADDHLADGSSGTVLDALQACLAEHFDVEHSIFQLEPASHAGHERLGCD